MKTLAALEWFARVLHAVADLIDAACARSRAEAALADEPARARLEADAVEAVASRRRQLDDARAETDQRARLEKLAALATRRPL